jgi:hypothetical protein
MTYCIEDVGTSGLLLRNEQNTAQSTFPSLSKLCAVHDAS